MKAFPSGFFRPFYFKTGSLNIEGRWWAMGREVDLGENGRGAPPLGLFGGSDISINLIG